MCHQTYSDLISFLSKGDLDTGYDTTIWKIDFLFWRTSAGGANFSRENRLGELQQGANLWKIWDNFLWETGLVIQAVFLPPKWHFEIFWLLPSQLGSSRLQGSSLALCVSQLCRRSPNQPMLMAPAEQHRVARSTHQSPKARTYDVKNFKAGIPNYSQTWIKAKCASRGPSGPNQQWQPEAQIEAWGVSNRSLRCVSKQEVLVEVGI